MTSTEAIGLLWKSDHPNTENSSWQHTTLKTDRNLRPRRKSTRPKPKSERLETQDSAVLHLVTITHCSSVTGYHYRVQFC